MYGVDFGNIFHFTVSLHFYINTKDHRKTDGLIICLYAASPPRLPNPSKMLVKYEKISLMIEKIS